MGQRITRNQLVFGIPAIQLRDTLRLIGNSDVSALWFAERLSLNTKGANKLVKELLKSGWLKTKDSDDTFFNLSEEGRVFALARATRPLRRASADALLEGAIEAAKRVNADGSLPSYVEELYVFGSYLGDAPTLGDLDIGLSMKRRYGRMKADQWVEWASEFGYANGAARNFLSAVAFHDKHIRRALKQRSSYIAIHDMDDLDAIGAKRKLVFKSQRVAAPRPMLDTAID